MRFIKTTVIVLLLSVTAVAYAESPAATKPEADSLSGITAKSLAGKRVVFLGDSITQAGGYISFVDYYLAKLYPDQDFDIYGLGLASETLSGLSEDGHAGGRFPRPCLFERLGRLLERAKPEVVFACYGINDGIYQPLDSKRFSAFQQGVEKLIEQCKSAGVEQIILVTPPIFDATTKPEEFNYDTVMTKYAQWETNLDEPGVQVIDLHSAMRAARDARDEVFSKDRVHPGTEGHLFMAQTILAGLGVTVPEESLESIQADPLFQQVDKLRKHRSSNWMKHIGYTREKTVSPQPLGDTQEVTAKLKTEIDELRRKE
ncbi:SGNH/GDSL hydrolase family protein [Bremerella sp. JC770]|uniref:SGNH/GDSL hydrolase family protein n=1 Tax=Bremerella sp. JC770 TaxID=3232137 RepID=UPI003458FD8E